MAKKKTSRSSARKTSASRSGKPASSKKTSTKKKVSKKQVSKKQVSKKTTAKKTTGKKTTAKQPATRKKTSKKSAAKKAASTTKRAASRNTKASKSSKKKGGSKRSTAKAATTKPANTKPAKTKPAKTRPAAAAKSSKTKTKTKTETKTETKGSSQPPALHNGQLLELAGQGPLSDEVLRKAKSGLTKRELRVFSKLLIERRAEVVGDFEGLQKLRESSDGDLSNMPLHMADVGSDNYDQEFTLGLMESERRMLGQIDDALLRIQNGTYGICLDSAQPIGKPRLEAKPWARYCIQIAQERERRGMTL